MASTPVHTVISTTTSLRDFLSVISPLSTLYLDLEGYNLCRHGTLSIITILIHPQGTVELIDVLALEEHIFCAALDNGTTLKSIFEDPSIPKGFRDTQNDADALWAHYHVGLAGVIDIQLLENASRSGDKTHLHGLDKAIQYDLNLEPIQRHR